MSAADRSTPAASIAAVGTSVPPTSYSQEEVLEALRVDEPRIRSLFLSSGIRRRHLSLPDPGDDGVRRAEPQGRLLAKHTLVGLEIGGQALEACVRRSGASLDEVRHLCCVSSTGFITPGFSALLIKERGLSRSCSRLDVVGMGCNAGLNALAAVAAWARANPGELAVMVCIEVCSAAYVFDGSMGTAVVNSLFGDGAAAIAVRCAPQVAATGPELLRFSSYLIPDAIDAMRFAWRDEQARFAFYLDPEVPYVIGAHAGPSLERLLEGTGLRRHDIDHWIVHAGGRKVIDAVRVNLELTRHDVRYTSSILRDYGNLSSGSFLFSYERLLEQGRVRPGDRAVLMTMGPGSTIEMALARW